MSFASDVKQELIELQIKKNCCRKSFLIGLLINAKINNESSLYAEFAAKDIAELVSALISTLYNGKPSISPIQKPGRTYYKVSFTSRSIFDLLDSLDNEPDASISEEIPFKCNACEQAFLRGAFISCGKLNDPQKGYQLEFTLSKENLSRASKLYRFLSVSGFISKIVNRKNSSGLYFKSNQTISDILYFMGAVKSSFEYENSGIEKEIINNENRATNCVARNIYKSVNASQKHIVAINKLITSHKLDSLPEELIITARLRIENESATLSELASMHNPPISKSGLNHRLEKLCLEAEIIDK